MFYFPVLHNQDNFSRKFDFATPSKSTVDLMKAIEREIVTTGARRVWLEGESAKEMSSVVTSHGGVIAKSVEEATHIVSGEVG